MCKQLYKTDSLIYSGRILKETLTAKPLQSRHLNIVDTFSSPAWTFYLKLTPIKRALNIFIYSVFPKHLFTAIVCSYKIDYFCFYPVISLFLTCQGIFTRDFQSVSPSSVNSSASYFCLVWSWKILILP